MKKVDALITRAKQLAPEEFANISFLKQEGDEFVLEFSLWDGKPHIGERKTLELRYKTERGALSAYQNLVKKHHTSTKYPHTLINLVLPMGGDNHEKAIEVRQSTEREGGSNKNRKRVAQRRFNPGAS